MADFACFCGQPRAELGADDVRRRVEHLSKVSGVGPQRIRQHMSALKFLYTKTPWKLEAVSFFAWPSDPQKLPEMATELGLLDGALHEHRRERVRPIANDFERWLGRC